MFLPLVLSAGEESFNIRSTDDLSQGLFKNWNGKVSTEFDPVLQRDVVKINFAVPPNTTKPPVGGLVYCFTWKQLP